MITINVVTKAVSLDRDTPVMARNQFGNATYGYVRGWIKPNYPMPAIYFVAFIDRPNRWVTIRHAKCGEGFDVIKVWN